jgi:N-acetylmuramoyl-L-alanine amidase
MAISQGAMPVTKHDRRSPGHGGRARLAVALIAVGAAASACGAAPGGRPAPRPDVSAEQPQAAPAGWSPAAATPTLSSAGHAAGSGGRVPGPARPLAGKVVGIDPGHDGGNFADPAAVGRQVWNGRELEACDTTGTETDGGFTEAQFNIDVARYLRADLRRDGARVVMTRTGNDGVGPCIDQRATMINAAHANAAVDIHADGGPAWGRGFTILEPVGDGPNDAVIASSARFGSDLRQAFLARVPDMPESTYNGDQGIMLRDDLAGLNLTTVPKVLVECGNMRNATDAGLLVSPAFQRQVATAIEVAIIRFLGTRP